MSRSIAFAFAHPDDESFAVGATIASYAAAGVTCRLFCATNGDAGTSSDVPVESREQLGALRRNELVSAARLLGIDAWEMPGHPDSALSAVDADVLVGEIVRAFRTWRPDVVVTFGPEGGRNSHRDHRAISRAATAAFFLSGLATQYPEQLHENGLSPHRPVRLFYCAWEPPAPNEELTALSVAPTAALVASEQARRVKRDAFLAHVTQRSLLPRFEQADKGAELFALAAGEPQPHPMIQDLLEGL